MTSYFFFTPLFCYCFWIRDPRSGIQDKHPGSVADPGCLSRIPDPGSWFLPIPDPGYRIPDPGSKNSNKRERWKKISCHTFLCSHKFHKIINYFSLKVLKKKIWANFQRIIELFTKIFFKKLLKIWSWDPRSGIRKKPIPDPGSRIQGSKSTQSWILDPGSGSATLHPGSATLLFPTWY